MPFALRKKAADSAPFIDFMLGEILNTLIKHQGEELTEIPNKVPNKVPNKLKTAFPDISDSAWDVYSYIKKHQYASATQVAGELGISDRMVRKHISTLKDAGIIEREGSNKTGRWLTNK